MLENHKASDDSLGETVADTTIGNQQVTLEYLAGLFEGEGSIGMTKVNVKKTWINYRPVLQFTNTEVELIKAFAKLMKDNGISYHVRGDERPRRKSMVCYQIQPGSVDGKIKLLELLSPYFLGVKKDFSKILLEFLYYRKELYDKFRAERNPKDGRYKSGCKKSYTEIDEDFYNRYKNLRGTSTTTRKTPYNFKDEDIV